MNQQEKRFIPVMLTPFLENGAIDYDGLTRLTEFYLEAGASGLFTNCQSSEMYHLQPSERVAITKHVVKTVNGRVPIVATGSFGGTLAQEVNVIRHLYELGVDAIILVTGMLATEEQRDEDLQAHFYQLLEATDKIPFGFYECPEPYKRLLTPALLGEFVNTGRVIYHKDTSLDIQEVSAKIAMTANHRDFGLYDAYMVHAVASLKAGAVGLSCIQGNFFPELVVWLCRYYNDMSKQEEVALVQQFFIDHMDVMHSIYPLIAKYFLQKRGLAIKTVTRKFVGVLDASVKQKMDQLYMAYGVLFEQAGIRK